MRTDNLLESVIFEIAANEKEVIAMEFLEELSKVIHVHISDRQALLKIKDNHKYKIAI